MLLIFQLFLVHENITVVEIIKHDQSLTLQCLYLSIVILTAVLTFMTSEQFRGVEEKEAQVCEAYMFLSLYPVNLILIFPVVKAEEI